MATGFPVNIAQTNFNESDGSGVGVIKAKIQNKELVKTYASDHIWTGVGASIGSVGNAMLLKSSGWNYVAQTSISSGNIGTNYASLSTYVNGRVIGIRLRDTAIDYTITGWPDATIIVDSVPYRLRDILRVPTITLNSTLESIFFIPEILTDGVHNVQMIVHPLSTGSHSIVCYGFVLEKTNLLVESSHKNDGIFGTGTLTTSLVQVPVINTNSYRSQPVIHRIKKIIYYNNDSVARIVTVNLSTSVLLKQSIPTQTTYSFDLPTQGLGILDTSDNALLTHSVDSGSLVSFTVMGDVQ